SLDQHVSIWGYYSRFNGGLLSTISYIALYYALVSNFQEDKYSTNIVQTVQKNIGLTEPIIRTLFFVCASAIAFLGFYFSYPKSAQETTNSTVLITFFIISFLLFVWSTSGLKKILRFLYIILISGVVVIAWGLPSHFGHDPTCLLLRGTFDVNCWTESFKPE